MTLCAASGDSTGWLSHLNVFEVHFLPLAIVIVLYLRHDTILSHANSHGYNYTPANWMENQANLGNF